VERRQAGRSGYRLGRRRGVQVVDGLVLTLVGGHGR
jgi:hypothetical protein